MDAAEHSRLLYLVDALQSAPGKSKQLLVMAEKPDASAPYRAAILRLRAAADEPGKLVAESETLKRDLR